MAKPERPYKPVGHTCLDINKVNKILRRHVPEPEQSEALGMMETLREENTQLRANALHHVQGTAPGA